MHRNIAFIDISLEVKALIENFKIIYTLWHLIMICI